MFPNFPNFRPLTIDDKKNYESFVKDCPDVSDISFPTLMIWWNFERPVEVSLLRGNVIIKYPSLNQLEGVGVSIVGYNAIKKCVIEILQWMHENGHDAKLLHVPSFVIDQLPSTSKFFKIQEEYDYNEYLIDACELSSLSSPSYKRVRHKLARFLRQVGEDLRVDELDITEPGLQDLLWNNAQKWMDTYGSTNDLNRDELKALRKTLFYGHEFGVRATGLYIGNEMHGYALYRPHESHESYILNHLKVQYKYPHVFDYIAKIVAEDATKNGYKMLNLEMDLGIEGLKDHKRSLRPIAYHRKFTIIGN